MRHVQGDLVLRPDLRKGLISVAVAVVLTVAIVVAILIGDAPTVFAPIVGGLFALAIILVIGSLLRSRLILTAHEIVVRGLFGRQRRPRSLVTEVVRATIVAPRGGRRESLLLLDEHHHLVIRISVSIYTRENLDQLVNALGVPCGGSSSSVDANRFAQTYPGLVSWTERHPYRIAFAVAGVVCAAVVALVLVSIATAP
jgi:hypothetical protein